MVKVSVIMPSYNPNEEWLNEALDSILKQTFKDFEIILVDDGSKNDEYLWDVVLRDKRIKVFFHKKNRNQASAMNTGLKKSSGDYICFLDCDDKYAPEKLKNQLIYLIKNKEVDMVYSDGWYIDEDGKIKGKYTLIDDPKNILKFNHISYLSVLIRKKVFDKVGYFDEKLNRSQDWDMWVRVYKAGFVIKKMKERLIYYRIHPKQKNVLIPIEGAHAYIRRKHNLI